MRRRRGENTPLPSRLGRSASGAGANDDTYSIRRRPTDVTVARTPLFENNRSCRGKIDIERASQDTRRLDQPFRKRRCRVDPLISKLTIVLDRMPQSKIDTNLPPSGDVVEGDH